MSRLQQSREPGARSAGPDPAGSPPGTLAVDQLLQGHSGRMVALQNGQYTTVPVDTCTQGLKRVDVDELYDIEDYRPKVRHVLGKPMFLY